MTSYSFEHQSPRLAVRQISTHFYDFILVVGSDENCKFYEIYYIANHGYTRYKVSNIWTKGNEHNTRSTLFSLRDVTYL